MRRARGRQRAREREARLALSGYKTMWVVAMFDLPVDDAKARRQYTRFRKALLAEGFSMLQFSVYARWCGSEEASAAHRNRVRAAIPPKGEVRLLTVTERQFSRMEVYLGKMRRRPEKKPEQLLLL